jgi:hypothetical protein
MTREGSGGCDGRQGETKTEAKARLRDLVRDAEDGFEPVAADMTVRQAVEDWLTFWLGRQGPSTVEKCRLLVGKHILPALGAPKLRALTTATSRFGSRSSLAS